MKSATGKPIRLGKREFLRLCAVAGGGCLFARNGFAEVLGRWEGLGVPPALTGTPGKWSVEALFCKETGRGILCQKCPNGCVLASGQKGKCRNRVNVDGKVYSIAYGNPCAVHVDPVEKKPLYHFLPGTRAYSIAVAGCNLRCLNCQNWQISQASPEETENVDLMPDGVVAQASAYRCASIAYTYSEPTTFYEYAFDTSALARKHGIRNVWKSNGYINEAPLRKLCRVIDAANIDLKGFDDTVYRKLNDASLEPVLRTLKVIKEEGVWLEITNLVIPTWTDDLATIGRMCEWLSRNGLQECPLHFSRFTPLYKLNQLPSTPVSVLEKAREIAMKAGMQYVYIGNVPGHKAESTFCPGCGAMVIERHGFVATRSGLSAGKCAACGREIAGVWS